MPQTKPAPAPRAQKSQAPRNPLRYRTLPKGRLMVVDQAEIMAIYALGAGGQVSRFYGMRPANLEHMIAQAWPMLPSLYFRLDPRSADYFSMTDQSSELTCTLSAHLRSVIGDFEVLSARLLAEVQSTLAESIVVETSLRLSIVFERANPCVFASLDLSHHRAGRSWVDYNFEMGGRPPRFHSTQWWDPREPADREELARLPKIAPLILARYDTELRALLERLATDPKAPPNR